MALASDIRITSADAFFGCPEISFGIITGLSGSVRIQRLTGSNTAKELLLTGELINAQTAYELGLVNRIVPKRIDLFPKALNLAALLADAGRYEANRYIKSLSGY